MSDFDGRVAIVSAAGSGIGQATTWLLAERGATVVAVDISEQGLNETLQKSEYPAQIHPLTADVTDPLGAELAIKTTVRIFSAINILVNVVGRGDRGRTAVDMPLEDWEAQLRLNLTSVFLMCKAATPIMAAAGGGVIVNIASAAGVWGLPNAPAYVAAKGGVISLTKALAIDHAAQGIRANCIAPGPILTPLMRRNQTPEAIERIGAGTLLGRLGDPREIATAVAFLVGDDSSYITGEVINVGGGMTNR
jgi:NAD(P)-dependent dehydrogenase (short-subunit alcohol dehydrogenase family)